MNGIDTSAVAGGRQEPFYGMDREHIVEAVVVASASADKAMSIQVPAYSILRYAEMKFEGDITLATAVKVGLGTSSDPDALLLSGTTVTGGTRTAAALNTLVSTATTYEVNACDTNGGAAGTLVGTVLVRLVYEKVGDALHVNA